jgi:hypothetical protein
VPMLNRVLATLLALALFLGGLLAVVEIVLAAFDRPAWLVPHQEWSTWLAGESFDDGVVRAALIGLVVVGLLLLLLVGLRRGKPGSIALPARTDGVRVTASRRGLERSLATSASRAGGVRSARAKVGRRAVRVKATTAVRSGDLQQPVTAGVTERLEELGLSGVLRPRVTVSQESAR